MSHIQDDWQSRQEELPQETTTLDGQSNLNNQRHQQPPTVVPTWTNFGNLVNQFHSLSDIMRETQQTVVQASCALAEVTERLANLSQQPTPSLGYVQTPITNAQTPITTTQPQFNIVDTIGP